MDTKYPVIAIVGPTASGKSGLAMQLAEKFGGEIICADSRTVYQEMDIGTAKPSAEDQKIIKHHCLDLIKPNQKFSAAEFKRQAQAAIKDISARDKIPMIVGGSGLYIDGLIYDFDFISQSNPVERESLEAMDIADLQMEAEKIGISADQINFKNKRHLARVVERGGVFSNKKALPKNIIILGIDIDKNQLDMRIENRIELMINHGMEDETRQLLKKYGANVPGLLAPGYKALIEHINGEVDIEQAKKQFIQNDKKLAKRQKTWFKRNQDILWIKNYPEATKHIADFLTKFDTIAM